LPIIKAHNGGWSMDIPAWRRDRDTGNARTFFVNRTRVSPAPAWLAELERDTFRCGGLHQVVYQALVV
jgi:hypothetical protein